MCEEPRNEHPVYSFRGVPCRCYARKSGGTNERVRERCSPSARSHKTSTLGAHFVTEHAGWVQGDERGQWASCECMCLWLVSVPTVKMLQKAPPRNEHMMCSFHGQGCACTRGHKMSTWYACFMTSHAGQARG